MTYQHNPDQINQLADKLEDPELASMSGLGWKAAFHLRELQGRIADLEAQLYAVGAGGVGQSIKPQIQADTAQEPDVRIRTSAPDGWKLVPMEPTDAMMNAAFDTEQISMEWGVDPFLENTSEVYKAMLAAVSDAPPPPPAQQEPVAWRVRPFNYGIGHEGVDALTTRKEQCEMWERKGWKVEPLYAAPQPTENLRCKSTQKRLATLWGYVKKEPDHFRDATQMVSASQPLTNEQIIAIADNARAAESGDAGYILPIAFARAIEAAVNGSQQ